MSAIARVASVVHVRFTWPFQALVGLVRFTIQCFACLTRAGEFESATGQKPTTEVTDRLLLEVTEEITDEDLFLLVESMDTREHLVNHFRQKPHVYPYDVYRVRPMFVEQSRRKTFSSLALGALKLQDQLWRKGMSTALVERGLQTLVLILDTVVGSSKAQFLDTYVMNFELHLRTLRVMMGSGCRLEELVPMQVERVKSAFELARHHSGQCILDCKEAFEQYIEGSFTVPPGFSG